MPERFWPVTGRLLGVPMDVWNAPVNGILASANSMQSSRFIVEIRLWLQRITKLTEA